MHQPDIEPSVTRLVGLAALTAAAAAIAATFRGIEVRGLLEPAKVVAIFALLAWLRPAFRYCLSSFAVYVAFSTSFIVLLYALGTSGWSLADPELVWFDQLLSFDAQRIALATATSPLATKVMYLVYFSAIPQTIILIIWMGFRHDSRLSLFLYRYMICGLVTAACFYLVPALGAAGTGTAAWNAGAARDLLALRSGELTVIDCSAAHGIVTFPSFHAIWAILLMCAVPTRPMILLNVLMIISTITTGGHYLIDVTTGILVCAIVVPITARQFAAPKDVASDASSDLKGLATV